MKRLFIFISLVVSCTTLFAQTSFVKIELKNIIKDSVSIRRFINSNFIDTIHNREDLLTNNHSLFFEDFNKQLKNRNKTYSIFGIKINDLFALNRQQDYALYLLMNLRFEDIDALIKGLGLPDNVISEEEIKLGNFHFLTWKKKSLFIWLNKDVFANSQGSTNNVILPVTNMQLDKIIYRDN